MISVILCTHNPRAAYLDRTLASLRAQTLDKTQWEFVLVDNHSESPLADRIDLSWHPRARVVREDELGLTPARLRGVAETREPILIFVDDDNDLDPAYLTAAAQIAETCPHLGAWGGECLGEFETAVPAWAEPYLCYLAIREVARATWGNQYDYNLVPVGAGMCVRRSVAEAYARDTRQNTRRRELDRRGNQLVSGGDSDLAFTAIDQGLGIGLFPSLKLKHLMPAGRLDPAYLERLLEGIAFSSVIVLKLHGVPIAPPIQSRLSRWVHDYKISRQPAAVKQLERARDRGRQRAFAQLQAWSQ